MSLQTQIQTDYKSAMKNRETENVGFFRFIIGEFQRQKTKEVSNDEVIKILRKLSNSLSENEKIAEDNKDLLSFIENYLPSLASEEDVKSWIAKNIDFGSFSNKMQAMKPIMAHFGTSIDGNVVKKIIENIKV